MTITKLKYGNPLALQALFASAGEPMPVKSLRDVGKLIWRWFPASSWAVIIGGIIGVYIAISYVWG